MLTSDAWRSLTTQARAVYIELAILFNGSNNGEIALSVRDAARRCKISKDTAAKAMHELADKGFIEITTPGAFGYKLRHATEYRLTDHEFRGQLASREFMSWRSANSEAGPK